MSDEGLILAGTLGGALGGAALGGIISFVTQFVTQRSAREAAVASERRQARMDERRHAVAQVVEFLDIAARADARRWVERSQSKLYDDNIGGMGDLMPRDKFDSIIASYLKNEPSAIELQKEFAAAAALAPSREIQLQLIIVWGSVGERSEGSTEQLRQHIQRARELVEDYIVGGD